MTMLLTDNEKRAFAAIFSVIAFGILLAFRPGPEPFEFRREFEPDVWQAHRRLQDDELTDQAERLVDRRTLKGMTRDGVVRFLGQPDSRDEQGSFVYNLGSGSSYSLMRYTRLIVRFEDERVYLVSLR